LKFDSVIKVVIVETMTKCMSKTISKT